MGDILAFVAPKNSAFDFRALDRLEVDNHVIAFTPNAHRQDRCVVLIDGVIFSHPYGKQLSDHEAVIRCYREHGARFPAFLEGDGGIILYDQDQRRLLAIRDRFGISPLFYFHSNDTIAVSSRILSLFDYIPVKKQVNHPRHLLYVGGHYRHIETPEKETFYESIYALEHGSQISYTNGNLSLSKYWDLELIDLSSHPVETIQEQYVALLKSSVASRLARSTRPAFTISSGMDSSSVAALASQLLDERVDLFTTVFAEDTEYNEHDEIVDVAERFGRSWNKILITGDNLRAILTDLVKQVNEPLATVTQLLHRFVVERCRQDGHDTVFGGLGGDEANCGEIEEYLFFFAELRRAGQEERLQEEIIKWAEYHGTPRFPKSAEVAEAFLARYIDFHNPGTNRLIADRFVNYMGVFDTDYKAAFYREPELAHPYKSYLLNKLYQDLFSETIPSVLKAESFNAKNFGVQLRLPYLDARVMQYGFSIPVFMKYKNGANKAVLRAAMKGILPDSTLLNFRKRGWNAPFGKWIKASLGPYIETVLENPTRRQREIYNVEYIRKLFDAHMASTSDHMMFFWQFVNYELWYDAQFQDAGASESGPARGR